MPTKKMKIAINARLLNERKGGPYRYLVNILNEICKLEQGHTVYLLVNNRITEDYSFLKNKHFKQIISPFKNKVFFDYIFIPFFSYLIKNDVYVFPKTTFAPYIRGKKIPIFHDIIYYEKFAFREFKFFENLHHTIMIKIDKKFVFNNISVSEFTAARMNELLNIKKDKINVIYEGVESSFKKITDEKILLDVTERLELKSPFLFFAGSLSPRKNVINLLKSFELIKHKIPHNIYFTAGDSWNDSDVYKYIKTQKLDDRIIRLGYLSEKDLVAVYNLADCYIYPSLYEGFGLPILEAQACGCPVITSNISSCPEIAGDSALLVDPYDPEKIADAIMEIVTSDELRKNLITKGLENISRFSWQTAALEHLKVFNKSFECED